MSISAFDRTSYASTSKIISDYCRVVSNQYVLSFGLGQDWVGFGFRFQILAGSVTLSVITLIIIFFFVKVLLGRFHPCNHHHYHHHHHLFVKVLVGSGGTVCLLL